MSMARFAANRKRDWSLYGHDTGIHPLNLMIGGWIPGKVTTIAARSGIGKTATTVEMFKAAGRQMNGRRAEVLFFTWEMTGDYLVDRHVCNRTGISTRWLMQGAKLLNPQQLKVIQAAYDEANSLPVRYQQASTDIATIKRIWTRFCEYVKEKSDREGVDILPVGIIDYVGMAKFDGAGLRTYGIADFMNGLKQLANKTAGAFCVFAQISRGADEKDIPQRGDLSDSKSIEDASDNLIIMHRPEYNQVPTIKDPMTGMEVDSDGKVLFRGLKGRDFGTGDILMNCDIKHYRFWDRHHEYDFDYWNLYGKKDFWVKHFGLDGKVS